MADTSKITLKQLKDAMNKAKNYTDNEIAGITGVSKVEPEELDMPKVFFYGTALPTTKDNVNLTMDYVSNTAKFSSFVKLKCQGTSSMSYAKKNFTVAMFSDESRTIKLKKDFKGWGAQSKFCLKANYVDTTHTRNISGARIAYDMVQSRPDSPFKQQLLQCPRNGAVDGFPIKLYFNGEFYGIYTWNIPKDGWMFNMDAGNANHMVLCAEKNNDSTNISDDILRCEFRMEWDGTDGNSWSIEFGTYSDALKNSFNRCVNFVMTATDEQFKTNIGQYFDLYSLLDYYCFSYLTAHIDGLAKNMLMATYDGVIWGATLYDMDSIYGADWQGSQFKATNIQCPEQYQDTNSLLWQRIESCFPVELYARYLELRQGALSLSNIIKHVEEIYDVIPDRVFVDEKAKWTSLPGVNTNTMTRFRNYMRDRAVYVDAQMEEIGTRVPCTGIVLSADTLSFTTTDTQTLSVVVSPENCTDTITWSVSPTRIVTVKNGVVTPIRNGEATITATCGSYSDTCAVTVSGISESGGGTDIYATAEYAITEPRTFNGTSDYIDTGIQLFDTAKDFAVYIDYTPTAGVTQVNNATVLHCVHEVVPYRGLTLMYANNDYFIGGHNANTASGYTANITGNENHKFIIQFANGVISHIKTINSGIIQNVTLLATAANNPYVQVTENLLLGCYRDASGTKGRYWNGTINKFAVWFKRLTDDEIQQVFDAEYVPSVSITYTNGYIARRLSHTTDGTTLGAIKESNSDITTDFISCTSNDVFNILAPRTTYGSGVVAYDSDKNYISTYLGNGVWESGTTSNSSEIKATQYNINNIPENTNYIRLCFNTTDSALITIMQQHVSANLLEGITWSANADNGIYNNASQGTPGVEKGSGNGDAYLSGQIPCSKKKYVLSNINGATFLYKEMYVYASDGTFLGGSCGGGKYNTDGDSDASGGNVTMDLRNIQEEPAYMRITAFPNHIASNNSPATQLKLITLD